MKTILTTLLLLCLITTQSFSQWEWQNPSPHGNANNRLAFGDDPNTYSIVGNVGIIIKTTDDGLNWEIQNSGTNVDLSDIYISGDNAIAVGKSGTIRRTTDGGNNWTTISSGTTANLTAVTFNTPTSGIITGEDGLLLRTVNSGESWNSLVSPTTYNLYGISFADDNNGIAVGDGGVVLKTTNGGVSWNSQTSGTVQSLYDVSYINSSTAVASGYSGTIIRTTNGGTTWTSIGLTTYIRWGVSFTDPDNGVVVGDANNVHQTTDGGANWTYRNLNLMSTNFHCVRFYNSTKGVAVGERGAIFKTEDGGITWQIITTGSLPRYQISGGVNIFDLYSVQFINSNRAVISGTYQYFYTNNGGVSWDYIPMNDYPKLIDLDFVNQDNGAMIGIRQSLQGSDILGTTNSGSNWSVQYTSNSIKLNSIDLSTTTHGVAVGDGGKILMTTNGGQNWNEQIAPQPYHIYDVFLVDSLIGYTVGKYGYIFKTIDGGINWTQQRYSLFSNLYGVAFSDANNGIAVGDSSSPGSTYGVILKTTNGGSSWSKQVLGTSLFFQDVTFADNNNWYAAGVSVSPPNPLVSVIGKIFRSTDAGNSWSEQNLPIKTTRFINGISAFDNENLIAVGLEGMVLATTNGGVSTSSTPLSSNAPAGSQTLAVISTNGFSIGEQITINPGGANEETNIITGFGSILLQTPLQFDHLAGEIVTNFVIVSVEEVLLDEIPNAYKLNQNYPNPFNPSTTISWQSPNSSHQTLKVYDLLGNEVATLVNEYLPTGTYKVSFDASGLSSGIYFYKLQAGPFVETKKMILVK